jgi:hypothetical protein
MPIPVSGKSATRIGTPLMRTAMDMARALQRTEGRGANKIVNGFLLRAIRSGNRYSGQVLDFPAYILFPGSYRNSESQMPWSGTNIAIAAGPRDDFYQEGTGSTFTVAGQSELLKLPDPPIQEGAPTFVAWSPELALDQKLMGIAQLAAPLKAIPPQADQWYLDDTDYFDYSTRCSIGAVITSLFHGARTLSLTETGVAYGEQPSNYFARNVFTLTEDDLPDAWRLYLRRILPLDESGQDYNQRRYPGDTMPGLAIDIARNSLQLVGTDRYCLAAQTFRQIQDVWGEPGSLSYDRNGERGLLIAVGVSDREDYNPSTGAIVKARTESLRIVMPGDIEQEYVRPQPAMIPGTGGGPDLFNFGTFYTPKPARAGKDRGFVVFSNYDTTRDLGGSTKGRLSSILTTLLNGFTVSLKADWDSQTGETLPTGTPGQFTRPWIAGAASIPSTEQGNLVWTAYAVVWESNYALDKSLSTGGNWALYKTAGQQVSRTVINGGAPLFAFVMRDTRIPISSSGFDNTSPFSAVYWMGGSKLVTAATQFPLPDNDFGEGRQIMAAIFDTETNQVTLGGVIAETVSEDTKCFITVVQPERISEDEQQVKPAVLLATVTEHKLRWAVTQGKTYLSLDGGASWSDYIADAAGPAGAFFAGNKLWAQDSSERFDERVFG